MNTVTVTQSVAAPPEAVREELQDIVGFMEAAGFDAVRRDGDLLYIENRVGMLNIDLTVRLVESDGVLAYEQEDGMFESMRTTYNVEATATGSEVRAETTFALDVAIVGDFLDATVVERQRRKELTAQLAYLADQTA